MSTLVVVDDERAFAKFVSTTAAAVGFQVTVATSAEDFRFACQQKWPSVLVMDLQMPGMDGIELIRELAQQCCTSSVVLLSGMDERVLDTAFRLGSELGLVMAGTLCKPVRAKELTQILTGLLESNCKLTAERLATAINSDELSLVYQPTVEIQTKRMIGIEALVRWRMKSGRLILPSEFIPLAEMSNLIDPLTLWVVQAAFRQLGVWQEKGFDLQLSVNLSVGNLHDRKFPDLLADLCSGFGLSPSSVTLELTETASTQDHLTLLEVLGRFRLKGFHLAIDDFGTGYSSVAQLLRLPFSELKIDRSFISAMHHSHEAAVVSKTLIDMAHNLGLLAIAEGVEAQATLDMLAEWRCDIAQGYFFSKPVESSSVESLLAMPSWLS